MAGITFARLPDEEPEWLDYLTKTGEVWARAVRDHVHNPAHEPLPVDEFVKRFADQVMQYGVVDLYLGRRENILQPKLRSHEVTEGGTLIPVYQDGRLVEGVQQIVGGTKVTRDYIVQDTSCFVRYKSGRYRDDGVVAISNLGYHTTGHENGLSVVPDEFVKWAKRLRDWIRRRTPASVPVYGANYETRATIKAAAASQSGVKFR